MATNRRKRIRTFFAAAAALMLALLIHGASLRTVDAAVYKSIDSAAQALRTAMTQRKTTVTVTANISGSYSFENCARAMSDIRDKIYDKSLEYTGAGNTGDYLYWTISSVTKQVDLTDIDDGYIEVDCTYKINYRDDASKESSVTKQVASSLSSLGVSGKSEYDKVKSIYDYITARVSYDYNEGNSSTVKSPVSYTAYGALINKKSVCQGYALLFYRMCNQAGVKCRLVTGRAKGSNGVEQHAWNIVRIGSKYYNVDATWDAAMKQASQDYEYFLKSNADLKSHAKDAAFNNSTFNKTYPMSTSSYPSEKKKTFKLTVKGGSGSGTYASGTIVTIKANAPVAGQKFSQWSGTATYVNGTSRTKSTAKVKVTKAATLTATYAYVTAAVSGGNYRVNSKRQAAKYMSVKSNSNAPNAQIILGAKGAKTSQFRITKSGEFYYIMNVTTKKYLNLSGSKVVQGAKNSTSRWRIVKSSNGVYRLVNQNGRTATLSSTNVTASADTNAASQQVKLNKN